MKKVNIYDFSVPQCKSKASKTTNLWKHEVLLGSKSPVTIVQNHNHI